MKVLIFGGSGMLGHKLFQILKERFDTFATIRGRYDSVERFGLFERSELVEQIDVTERGSIRRALGAVRPDVVVNASGVIKQVPTARSVVPTLLTNSVFPHLLADLSPEFGFRLITISTDCVFSGTKGNYREDDLPDAQDLYGKSKQFGEIDFGNALSLRTSIIGRELALANGLVEWMLSNRGKTIRGYTNAIFSGLPTVVLSDVVARLISDQPELTGLYHVSSDPISKYDLLELIKRGSGLDITIEPFDEVRIDRSLDSSRFRKATGVKFPGWPEMVDRMVNDPTPYEEFRS